MSSLESEAWAKNLGRPANRAAAALLVLAALPFARTQQIPANSGFHDVSLAEYRQHLEELDGVVSDCAAQLKTWPANESSCDPSRVESDDRVQGLAGTGMETREVRYDWLRSALGRASGKESGAAPFVLKGQASAKSDAPNPNALLNDAHRRLQLDEQQIYAPLLANPAYSENRKSLNAILARSEYRNATEITDRDRALEWLDNLLNRIFMRLAGFGARVPWIARLLELLLLAAVLTVLIWLLIRLERNARVRLVPDVETAPGAASARQWQLWLKDAETAAAAGAWRDAIHSLYWASISRLESNRLWPADGARTPREYLALLGGADARKATLTALTRSFERTWYGGREAAAADFNAALHLAAELGVEAK